eukprot:4164355-Amphidinium_carterae.1
MMQVWKCNAACGYGKVLDKQVLEMKSPNNEPWKEGLSYFDFQSNRNDVYSIKTIACITNIKFSKPVQKAVLGLQVPISSYSRVCSQNHWHRLHTSRRLGVKSSLQVVKVIVVAFTLSMGMQNMCKSGLQAGSRPASTTGLLWKGCLSLCVNCDDQPSFQVEANTQLHKWCCSPSAFVKNTAHACKVEYTRIYEEHYDSCTNPQIGMGVCSALTFRVMATQ